jgi:hypothetical protein
MHIQVKSEVSNGETIMRMMSLDKTFKRTLVQVAQLQAFEKILINPHDCNSLQLI